MEDGQIVELFFARSESAIEAIDQKYGRLCFRLAKNLHLSNEDAQECVNDTYLALWNRIPPVRPGSLLAFTCRIARNTALKKLEAANAKKRTPGAGLLPAEVEALPAEISIAPQVEQRELADAINRFLWAENELARNVFLRKYWFFDPVKTIAERYGISDARVKSMLFRTRHRLRDFLRKEGFEG